MRTALKALALIIILLISFLEIYRLYLKPGEGEKPEVSFRYVGSNIIPDSSGKYYDELSSSEVSRAVRLANGRAYVAIIDNPLGKASELKALHGSNEVMYGLTRNIYSTWAFFVNAAASKAVDEMGGGYWQMTPLEPEIQKTITLDSEKWRLTGLAFMPLGRDGLVWKLMAENRYISSPVTPASGDAAENNPSEWDHGNYVTPYAETADYKEGSGAVKFSMTNPNDLKSLWYKKGVQLAANVPSGAKFRIWYKADTTVTFTIRLHTLNAAGESVGQFYKYVTYPAANVWKEYLFGVGPGSTDFTSYGSPSWAEIDKIEITYDYANTAVSDVRLDGVVIFSPQNKDLYCYYCWDVTVRQDKYTEIEYDATNKVIKAKNTDPAIGGDTPYLKIGGSVDPTGYRCTTENFSTTKTFVDGARPIPGTFNAAGPVNAGAGATPVYAYLCFKLTVATLSTGTLYVVLAFSGITGTEAHALDEFNYLKANVETERTSTKNAYNSYIGAFPTLNRFDAKVWGAYYWALPVLKSCTFPKGLYVTGWNDYWGRDTLWAALGLLCGGKFNDAYTQITLFTQNQAANGQIPDLAGGGYSAIDVTPAWCYLVHQYYFHSRNQTNFDAITIQLKKAYDWLISLINDTYKLMKKDNALCFLDGLHPVALPNHVAYDTAPNIVAWRVLKEAYEIFGDPAYKTAADKLQTGLTNMWLDDYSWYGGFRDTTGSIEFPEKLEAPANAFALAMGYATRDRALKVLGKLAGTAGGMDGVPICMVYPTYTAAQGGSDTPNYQNGGSWPYMGAVLLWGASQFYGEKAAEFMQSLAEMDAVVEPFTFNEWHNNQVTNPAKTNYGSPASTPVFVWTAGLQVWSLFKALGLYVDYKFALKIHPVATNLDGVSVSGFKVGNTTFNLTYIGKPDGALDISLPTSYLDAGTHNITVNNTSHEIKVDGTLVASRSKPYVSGLEAEGKITLDSWSWNLTALKATGQVTGATGVKGTLKIKLFPTLAPIDRFYFKVGSADYRARDYYDPNEDVLSIPITCSSSTPVELGLIPDKFFVTRSQIQGVDIGVVRQEETGLTDEYGNPVLAEATTVVKGFIALSRGDKKRIEGGDVPVGDCGFLLPHGTEVDTADYEIDCYGARWKILGVSVRRSHIEVFARRKIEI